MEETYADKEALQKAQTHLSSGEMRGLSKLQKKLCAHSRADAIRQVLRERMKSEGVL